MGGSRSLEISKLQDCILLEDCFSGPVKQRISATITRAVNTRSWAVGLFHPADDCTPDARVGRSHADHQAGDYRCSSPSAHTVYAPGNHEIVGDDQQRQRHQCNHQRAAFRS